MRVIGRVKHYLPFFETNSGSESGGGDSNENESKETEVNQQVSPQIGFNPLEFYQNGYNEMLQKNQELQGQLFTLMERMNIPQQVQPQKAPEPEPDFDNMTNKQLFQHIVTSVSSLIKDGVNEGITPLKTEVENTNKAVKMNSIQMQVQDCMRKYPDYLRYANQMQKYAEDHNNLTPEEVYAIVKHKVGGQVFMPQQQVQQVQQQTKAPAKGTEKPSPLGGATEKTKFTSVSEAIDDALNSLPEDMKKFFY